MKRMFLFLIPVAIGMFLPVINPAQTTIGIDTTARTYSPPLFSASAIIVDSATAAKNRVAMYQQQKVKRDTTKPVTVSRDSVWQDNKIVGYFKFSEGSCYVYSPGEFLLAHAENTTGNNWRINYFANGTKHDLVSNGFFEEDIATFLVKQGYL